MLIFLVVFFVTLACIFYFIVGNRTEASLVDQMLHREQIVVRAGARSISTFLELSGSSLTLLAKDYCVAETNKDTQTVLDDFITEWEETPLMEVVLIDEEGVVQFVANKAKAPLEPGVLVTDRDYFIAAKKALSGEIFVGKPFLPRIGAFKGQYLLPLSTPIIVDGERRGVLGAGILLSELTKNYLDSLRISEDTQVYLIDQEGVFLHSFHPELVGKNAIEYIEENSYPGSDKIVDWIKEKLTDSKEGKYVFPMRKVDDKTKFERYLLAYSPLSLGERHFILAVATPQEDALAFFGPFYGNQIGALVFIIFMVLAFSTLLLLAVRMVERDGYLRGLKDGRNHKKTLPS